ncbi:MAG TPA: CYTH domain-containing protein [Planctomycetota bacterium]|nr:CYTH domain-containing protein [Planctomycetota bacterium]
MPKEIEHKFLVRRELLPKLPAPSRLIQGYLCIRPTVRVRLATRGKSTKAWLTIKGPGLLAREEFEYSIPAAEAKQLLKLCGSAVLEKNRYKVKGWEIDEFLGRHTGLWMAEYELKSVRGKLPKLPEWVGAEVTSDGQYTNASLALGAGVP